MLQLLERIIIDPYSENSANRPLELAGQRIDEGHGIYLIEHSYPPPEKKSVYVGGISTEGQRRIAPGMPDIRKVPMKLWVAEQTGGEQVFPAATNVIRNPSFELSNTDPIGWAAWTYFQPGTVVLDTSDPVVGESCLRVSPSNGYGIGYGGWTGLAASPGQVWSGSIWVKMPVGRSYDVVVSAADSNGPRPGGNTIVTTIGNGKWQRVVVNGATCPSGTTGINLYVQSNTPWTGTFWVDGAMLVQAATCPPYFDGDTPGASWAGTPHASSSSIPEAGRGKRFIAALHDLEEKIAKLQESGGTLKRLLPSGDSVVFDVVEASYNPAAERPFSQHRTEVDVEFTCEPYVRRSERAVPISDDFGKDTITNGEWTYQTGSGLSVSGGQLVPSSTTEKRLTRPLRVAGFTAWLRIKTGASVASTWSNGMLKYKDNNANLIGVQIGNEGSGGFLRFKAVDGSWYGTNVMGTATTGITFLANTEYLLKWVQEPTASVVTLTAALYLANDPTTPIATCSYTDTSGSGGSNWGGQVSGSSFGLWLIPKGTDERYDDWRVESLSITQYENTKPVLIGQGSRIDGAERARGKWILEDEQAVSRRMLLWGIETDELVNFADTKNDVYWEAEDLTPLGAAAAAVGPSGAFGGGTNKVISHTALDQDYIAMLNIRRASDSAYLTHVGSYRVVARMQRPAANTGTVSVALEWAFGDLIRFRRNDEQSYPAAFLPDRWHLVDLGVIQIPKAKSGPQRWVGQVIAKSTSSGDDLYIDWICLIPVLEAAGEIRGVASSPTQATALIAKDDFNGYSTNVNLTGLTASAGGTWQGGGDADDIKTGAGTTAGTAVRSVVNDTTYFNGRICYLNGNQPSNVEVQVDLAWDQFFGGPGHYASDGAISAVIARLTGTANFVMGGYIGFLAGFTPYYTWAIWKCVSSVITAIATADVIQSWGSPSGTIKLGIDSGGTATLRRVNPDGSNGDVLCSGQDSLLATGGSLDDGYVGLYDGVTSGVPIARYYDNFKAKAATALADAAIYASQGLEIRHNGIEREDSGGVVLATPGYRKSDLLRIPPAGSEERRLRWIALPSRGDWTSADDRTGTNDADNLASRLLYQPRDDVVPEPS